ncbi:MAG: sulfurtransferase complex subunit TusD [Proteobacteria bacterium]|nr:sulfurtransferase complex subunit TusD [Pseudomonadota bacterium]
MKFSIVVYAAPYSTEAASTALNFSKALLSQGHEIYRLFFFSDGVHNANRFAVTAQDDINLQQQWDKLISHNGLDSVVCVTSAIRRGILDAKEAERHEFKCANLHESSEIAGLGQLIDAALNSDRIVNFG